MQIKKYFFMFIILLVVKYIVLYVNFMHIRSDMSERYI